METQERKICRLCLKICDKFKALDEDTRDIFDIILPNIKLTPIQKSVMCTDCATILFQSFDFKSDCIYTQHDYIVPFIDNKDAIKLDLKDVYLSKNEKCTGVPENQDICGLCMGSVKNCFAIFFGVKEGDVLLEKMIRQCLPELDFSFIKKPVICPPCRDSLETCFRFVMNCLSVEDKIKKYCETLDVRSKDRIDLSHLLQFTMTDVTTDEADGNLEKQLSAERENADDMDNMIFNNEEFIENVLPCIEESKNLDVIEVEGEGLCKENNLIEENLEKMEDQKCLLNEEIEIKTYESDFYRLEDSVALPRPEVTKRLCIRLERLMPNLERDLSKPCNGQKLTDRDASGMYKCDSCIYQAKHMSTLKVHSLKHKDRSEVTMYRCPSCPHETKYKHAVRKHWMLHKDCSEVTMYKCASCSFQTKRKGHLSRHILVHKNPLKVKIFKCGSCSFKTKYKNNHEKHLLKHKDPFIAMPNTNKNSASSIKH